jgi:hypothetical protein
MYQRQKNRVGKGTVIRAIIVSVRPDIVLKDRGYFSYVKVNKPRVVMIYTCTYAHAYIHTYMLIYRSKRQGGGGGGAPKVQQGKKDGNEHHRKQRIEGTWQYRV